MDESGHLSNSGHVIGLVVMLFANVTLTSRANGQKLVVQERRAASASIPMDRLPSEGRK